MPNTLAPNQPVDVSLLTAEHSSAGLHSQIKNLRAGLLASRPASPVVGDVYISTDTPKISYCAVATVWIDILGTAADIYAKVDVSDTTAGYLWDKLLAQGLDKRLGNASGNETITFAMFPGQILDYAGITPPAGWLMCNGQAVSRTTYANLFAVLCPSYTMSVTIAAPAVISITAHGLSIGDAFRLTTTGALPTGLVAGTTYYVSSSSFGANSFRVSSSYANAVAGTNITTTGTQSGTHTLQRFNHGVGDGSTTFNVPDYRGYVVGGKDSMGGTSANVVTNAAADTSGVGIGEENHALITAELAAHTHSITVYDATGAQGAAGSGPRIASGGATGSNGSGTAHNTMQPTKFENKIISY